MTAENKTPTNNGVPEIRVSLLGRFELSVGDTVVSDDANRSKKMWNLLAYIITHRTKFATKDEFIELLWPEENSQNPANALKTLLYRIRGMTEPLSEACGGEEIILAQRGGYSWNSNIRCWVDAEAFEQLCKQADNTTYSDDERMAMYTEAVALYQGDFLPKLSDELWTVSFSTYYHSMYLEMVKGFCLLLQQKERYEEMEKLCIKAIEIDGLNEEVHSYMVLALLRQGKDNAALAHYEMATDRLYRNLGVRPSEQLRALYMEIMKMQKAMETDLGIIQAQLRETEAIPGAFVCEYGFFREAYRLAARRMVRDGISMYIAIITVSTAKGDVPPLNLLNQAMDQLLEILRTSLRKGDVVARYSGAQYVVMLPSLTYEDGEMVMGRIIDKFYRGRKGQTIKLHYKLQQLELYDV